MSGPASSRTPGAGPLSRRGFLGLLGAGALAADRAVEGRYGVSELLLYSSVCGTGLDVVPLPGDVPA